MRVSLVQIPFLHLYVLQDKKRLFTFPSQKAHLPPLAGQLHSEHTDRKYHLARWRNESIGFVKSQAPLLRESCPSLYFDLAVPEDGSLLLLAWGWFQGDAAPLRSLLYL